MADQYFSKFKYIHNDHPDTDVQNLRDIVAADFNCDGYVDLASISYTDGLFFSLGNKDGFTKSILKIQDATDFRTPTNSLHRPFALSVCDINKDKKPDLALIGEKNSGQTKIYTLLNIFECPTSSSTTSTSSSTTSFTSTATNTSSTSSSTQTTSSTTTFSTMFEVVESSTTSTNTGTETTRTTTTPTTTTATDGLKVEGINLEDRVSQLEMQVKAAIGLAAFSTITLVILCGYVLYKQSSYSSVQKLEPSSSSSDENMIRRNQIALDQYGYVVDETTLNTGISGENYEPVANSQMC